MVIHSGQPSLRFPGLNCLDIAAPKRNLEPHGPSLVYWVKESLESPLKKSSGLPELEKNPPNLKTARFLGFSPNLRAITSYSFPLSLSSLFWDDHILSGCPDNRYSYVSNKMLQLFLSNGTNCKILLLSAYHQFCKPNTIP